LLRLKSLWEDNLEDYKHIAELPCLLVERKSFALQRLKHTRLYDLSWLAPNIELAAVEMGELEGHSQECIGKGDCLLIKKVCTLPFEPFVWLLLANNDHVAGFHAW